MNVVYVSIMTKRHLGKQGPGGMGFKDLAAFNVAMLGKQGWHLQTDLDSLVSRICKAQYYPNSSYL